MISVVLTVHNKQDMLENVLMNILHNSSTLVKEFIIILDGCSDSSEDITHSFVRTKIDCKFSVQILYAPDVWEVKACNMGLKAATQPFIVSTQDDLVITELGWDIRLLKPFLVWNDVFAVTSLAALDISINEAGEAVWSNATNLHNSPRNVFAIRDVVNRGPLMFRHSMLEELDYLDEVFAPMGSDDQDICFRAWERGWVSGVYPMPHFADPSWGTTRNNINSLRVTSASDRKNWPILRQRHQAAMLGAKHDENRLLEC